MFSVRACSIRLKLFQLFPMHGKWLELLGRLQLVGLLFGPNHDESIRDSKSWKISLLWETDNFQKGNKRRVFTKNLEINPIVFEKRFGTARLRSFQAFGVVRFGKVIVCSGNLVPQCFEASLTIKNPTDPGQMIYLFWPGRFVTTLLIIAVGGSLCFSGLVGLNISRCDKWVVDESTLTLVVCQFSQT